MATSRPDHMTPADRAAFEKRVRLADAAEDMLAALQALLEHEGERDVSGIGIEHDSDALDAAKKAAHAAIDKANNGAHP